MGQSVIKNPRKIWSQAGGGTIDPSIETRITYLENNEYQIIYWAPISSASGSITKPTDSTIILDQFQEGADAFVTTIVNGQPTGIFPQTSSGVGVDVSSFDALGNYTLSGTPSAFDVALIYVIRIRAVDYQNVDLDYVIEQYDSSNQTINPRVSTITSSLTPSLNIDDFDELHITALAGNITSMTTNLTGTAYNGRQLIFTFNDNGVARTITWGAAFVSMLATLPTTTIVGKKLSVGVKYNSATSLWECWVVSYSV